MSGFSHKRDITVLGLTLLFLITTLGAVSRNGRERAKRMVCAAHLKRQVQVLLNYGADHEGRLPTASAGGWLMDYSVSMVNELLALGVQKEMFYCPANSAQQQSLDTLWCYCGDEEELWDGEKFISGSGYYVVAGYCFLLKGRYSSITQYPTDTESKDWIGTTRMENPATKELVIDIIMGEEDSDAQWGYHFDQISGGLASQGVYDRTNHLINSEEPAGSNIGFLDGHVDWRRWDPPTYPYVSDGVVQPRLSGSSASPAFWW